MSYHTHFDGDIQIVPPLTWREIRNSPYFNESTAYRRHCPVTFETQSVVEDTTTGPLRRITAVGILINNDETRADDVVKAFGEIAKTHGEAHRFVGSFEAGGEQAGDLWRIKIEGTEVTRVWPAIVWPDDPDLIGHLAKELAYMVPTTLEAGFVHWGAGEFNGFATDIIRSITGPAQK